MRKRLTRLGLYFICLVFISTFFGGLCNPEDDDAGEPEKCGALVQKYKKWKNTDDLNPADHFVKVDGSFAIYEYAIELIDNVCAHQHIKGTFEVEKYLYTSLIYQAEVVYGVMFTYPIGSDLWTLNEYGDAGLATAKFEFGMKNVYGDDPGWFLPMIKIFFPASDSLEETHKAFKERINYVLIEYEYYQWKDNS
jgi:hypothetical protein